MREEHEVRKLGLAHPRRDVGELGYLRPRGFPKRLRLAAHEKRSIVLGRPREVQQVSRLQQTHDLQNMP